MPVPNAVVLDLATLDRDDLDLAPLHATGALWDLHASTDPARTAERIAGAHWVVSS